MERRGGICNRAPGCQSKLDFAGFYFNPFHVTALFLYLLKTTETRDFLIMRVQRNTSGMKRLYMKCHKLDQISVFF